MRAYKINISGVMCCGCLHRIQSMALHILSAHMLHMERARSVPRLSV